MKMRVLGFAWKPDNLPPGIPATAVFDRMAEVSGTQFKDYLGAVTRIDDWWAGIVLKIRDAKAFTKLRNLGGVIHINADSLPDGEQMVEANFFVAHQSNGHGLYSYHYLSSSLNGDFAYFCHRRFSEVVQARRDEALEAAEDEKQKKGIRKRIRGFLEIEQVLKPGTFDNYVRQLSAISSLEANLVTFELQDSWLRQLEVRARRKKIILGFGTDSDTGNIAAEIVAARQAARFDKATVVGKDSTGTERTYKTVNDHHVFDEWDYDDAVRDLSIRSDDLEASIRDSPVIKRLRDLADSNKVKGLLGIEA